MKTLEFTPENLERHLLVCKGQKRRIITTVRRHSKGDWGDLFKIDGAGYFVLNSTPAEYSGFESVAQCIVTHFGDEGFTTPDGFADELEKLYGKIPRKLYLHRLYEVYGIEGGHND